MPSELLPPHAHGCARASLWAQPGCQHPQRRGHCRAARREVARHRFVAAAWRASGVQEGGCGVGCRQADLAGPELLCRYLRKLKASQSDEKGGLKPVEAAGHMPMAGWLRWRRLDLLKFLLAIATHPVLPALLAARVVPHERAAAVWGTRTGAPPPSPAWTTPVLVLPIVDSPMLRCALGCVAGRARDRVAPLIGGCRAWVPPAFEDLLVGDQAVDAALYRFAWPPSPFEGRGPPTATRSRRGPARHRPFHAGSDYICRHLRDAAKVLPWTHAVVPPGPLFVMELSRNARPCSGGKHHSKERERHGAVRVARVLEIELRRHPTRPDHSRHGMVCCPAVKRPGNRLWGG